MPTAPAGKIELLAVAVAAGGSVRAWSEANQVPQRTAFAWAARAEFKARVLELRAELVRQALGKLVDASGDAVQTLRDLMGDGVADNVRLGAARAVMGTLIDLRTHAEFDGRIAELERRFSDVKHS